LQKHSKTHLRAYAADAVDIKVGEGVDKVEKIEGGFKITTNKGSYEAKTILVTTGSMRRKLEVPGADKFEHKGLTYCASCDGPLFAGMDVVVVGGGNAGFESAASFSPTARR
jgi:alkyl hydroperoxide reductase subunit AhpF